MNLSNDALVGINFGILVAGFVVPFITFLLYAWMVHAIAWISDSKANMDESWVEKLMGKFLKSSYRDYFPHAAAISALICVATIICILGYWLWPVKYIAGLAVAIFISMHALRWMARTAKSLTKLRKLAHEHDEAEKSEDHEMLKAA